MSQPTTLPGSNKLPGKKILIVLLVLAALILAAVNIIAIQKRSNLNSQQIQPTNTPQVTPSGTQNTNQQQTSSVECTEFPDMLENCTKYTCQFTHPLTGGKMTKEILGVVNNTCSYTEEIPNNGRMNCNYTESMRKAVAQYDRDLANATSSGTEVSSNLGGETKITYTIDGKRVENPSQEALDEGQCKISGY
jgi:uncharacterized protein YxeA